MNIIAWFHGAKKPSVTYLNRLFSTPMEILRSRNKGWKSLVVAIVFMVIWIAQIIWGLWGLWSLGTSFIHLISPKIIDTSESVRQEITSRINERTLAIQDRNCAMSAAFESKFTKGTKEQQDTWVNNCNKFSEDQRWYYMMPYIFENIDKRKAQVRYFEMREMSVNGNVKQQYYVGKLYFEKMDGIWMIVNATRNPLKQAEQNYVDL